MHAWVETKSTTFSAFGCGTFDDKDPPPIGPWHQVPRWASYPPRALEVTDERPAPLSSCTLRFQA